MGQPVLDDGSVSRVRARPAKDILRTVAKCARRVCGKSRRIEVLVDPLGFAALMRTNRNTGNDVCAVLVLLRAGVVVAAARCDRERKS